MLLSVISKDVTKLPTMGMGYMGWRTWDLRTDRSNENILNGKRSAFMRAFDFSFFVLCFCNFSVIHSHTNDGRTLVSSGCQPPAATWDSVSCPVIFLAWNNNSKIFPEIYSWKHLLYQSQEVKTLDLSWSLSQLSLGERQGTLWTGRQSPDNPKMD